MKSSMVAYACSTMVAVLLCVSGIGAQEPPSEVSEFGKWTLVPPDAAHAGSVSLALASDTPISYLFGAEGPATLVVQCKENNTSLVFDFGDNFMSDIADYGMVVLAMDQQASRSLSLIASSDHKQLELGQGAAAIPVISSLFDGSVVQINAKPLYGQSFDTSFDITGLRQAIAPLREACRW